MKEIKKTEMMEELRIYMVNTEWIYNAISEIVKDIVNSETKKVTFKHYRRAERIAYEAAMEYKSQGFSLGHMGCRQRQAVGREVLKDEVDEAFLFFKNHGTFSRHLCRN